ncbi:MAG: NRDE family protein [Gammaproteobacteria bacterium]|nr:NRDE family protein [Gammaproteobacteria bacterium]
MCLILLAHRVHPEFPLIVAANRDEFHGRAAAAASFWQDQPQVLAGRDLEAGGTWLGVSRSGRFAAVTNFSEEPVDPLPPRSRGTLVSDFLAGTMAPHPYLTAIARHAEAYKGFNLLVSDGDELWYYSNRIPHPQRLDPGTYGLSNHLLDTDWPRVKRGKSALTAFEEAEQHPDAEALLALLADETTPTPAEIASSGLDPGHAGRITPCFIRGPVYGTRASTVVLIRSTREIRFTEVGFAAEGRRIGRKDFSFERAPAQHSSPLPGSRVGAS